LKAPNGKKALNIINEKDAGGIDLVVTDMVMPEMGGRMMADWLQAMRPGMKMLFTSGYTDWGNNGEIDTSLEFLPKPYTPVALLRKVRDVLDGTGAGPGEGIDAR
jgi:DNA-binding NtrC family response regulator